MKPSKKTRVREMPLHRSFKLSKKPLKQAKPLPTVRFLLTQTYQVIWGDKQLFFGLAAIYAGLSFIFVQGNGSVFQLSEIQNNFEEIFGADSSKSENTLAMFGYLISSAGASVSEAAGVYQMAMVLILSLAVIWGVRQVQAGESPGIRDTLYKGMYPLIPFSAVLLVVFVQLLPLVVGNLIYGSVLSNEVAVTIAERAIWLLLFALLALLSAYMITSSIFGLYIATLPDMRPIKALRSARQLVMHRRLGVGLRLFALPAVLGIAIALIFIPLLFVIPGFVEVLFLLATSVSLVIVHIYVYLLYRELI